MNLDKTQMQSAFAFVSVMLLAAAIYSAPAIRAETTLASAQSFVGTTPDASGTEVEAAPTF